MAQRSVLILICHSKYNRGFLLRVALRELEGGENNKNPVYLVQYTLLYINTVKKALWLEVFTNEGLRFVKVCLHGDKRMKFTFLLLVGKQTVCYCPKVLKRFETDIYDLTLQFF